MKQSSLVRLPFFRASSFSPPFIDRTSPSVILPPPPRHRPHLCVLVIAINVQFAFSHLLETLFSRRICPSYTTTTTSLLSSPLTPHTHRPQSNRRRSPPSSTMPAIAQIRSSQSLTIPTPTRSSSPRQEGKSSRRWGLMFRVVLSTRRRKRRRTARPTRPRRQKPRLPPPGRMLLLRRSR
jgi:hypothetical protein